MSGRTRSVVGRAAVMLMLFAGFYVLAAGIALALVAAPVLEWVYLDQLHLQLLVLSLTGLGILRSLLPRRSQAWVDPGPRFTERTQPDLVALIRRVAGQVGQPMPAELYFIDDLNAFVTVRGGVLGFGGRRVLAVGVPLMMALDTEELASVIAHEFGHFHGGDTRLGPLVYRTRATMARTLAAARGWLRGIFKAYAAFYLARTQQISREQELAADRLAARITSPRATAAALARLPRASAAFAYYRNQEYAPVLAAGRQPPYLSGYNAVLFRATALAGQSADVALGSGTGSRYDSHPSQVDRVRALGVDPDSVRAVLPETPATVLLRDPAAVQDALVAGHRGQFPEERASIRWEDVAQQVLLPQWRASVVEHLAPVVPGLAPAGVPYRPDDLAELGDAIVRRTGRTAPRPERESTARVLCGRYLAVAAVDAGWTMHALPGEPIRFTRDGRSLDVLGDYTKVCNGELDPDVWRHLLRSAGVSAPVRPRPEQRGVSSQQTPAAGPATVAGDMPASAGPVVRGPVTPEGVAAAAPPGTATAGPAPFRFSTSTVVGRALEIDGPVLVLGRRRIDAREVTAVGIRKVNGQWEARFAAPSGALRLRCNPGRKGMQTWAAVLRWSALYVMPRLVDARLAQLDRTGRVDIDGVTFTRHGVMTRQARMPWAEFAGTSIAESRCVLHRRADNLDGRKRFAAVRTGLEHGGAVVPMLCPAILASQR